MEKVNKITIYSMLNLHNILHQVSSVNARSFTKHPLAEKISGHVVTYLGQPGFGSLKLPFLREGFTAVQVYSLMDLERFACGPSNGSKCAAKYTSRRGLSQHQTICKYYKRQQDVLAAKRKERAKATVRKKVMFRLLIICLKC